MFDNVIWVIALVVLVAIVIYLGPVRFLYGMRDQLAAAYRQGRDEAEARRS